MLIFVINLDRHRLRMERMTSQLDAAGVGFERLPAVDGTDLGEADIAEIVNPAARERFSRFEVACLLSHRAAWRRFLAGGDELCCVLEDDVRLAGDFGTAMRSARDWATGGFDLIKVETMHQQVWVSRRKQPALPGYALSTLRSSHQGTAGYIVTRQGAERLLDLTAQMDRPVDDIIFGVAIERHRMKVLQMEPALCIQEERRGGLDAGSEFRSSIDPARIPLRKPRVKRKGLAKLTREIARPFEQLFQRLSLPGYERVTIAFEDR